MKLLKSAIPAMVVSLGAAMSLLYQEPSYAKLTICNRLDRQKIFVVVSSDAGKSVVKHLGRGISSTQSPLSRLIVEGWWPIEPGDCEVVSGDDLTNHSGFYYYAHAPTRNGRGGLVWRGEHQFCVTKKRFRISRIYANQYSCNDNRTKKKYGLNFNSRYYSEGFRFRSLNGRRDFTLSLTPRR